MKPSPKELSVAADFRGRIVAGTWVRGDRIPSFVELERIFPVSRVTLHRAVARLKAEGFLKGVERQGVYVSQHPPHLSRIALLLAKPERSNRFAACLVRDAEEIAEAEEREFPILRRLNGELYREEEARTLRGDLAVRRIAGMFVAFDPVGCPAQDLFDAAVPKVYLTPGSRVDGIHMRMDAEALTRRALEWLKSRGARRIAVLAYAKETPFLARAERHLGTLGLESRSEWRITMENVEIAEHIVKLMLAAEKRNRPDGLFIADDNVTEYALRGVIASGVSVPDEFKIISHCNWTEPPQRPIPIELIGFDTKEMLRKATSAIDAINRGEKASSPLKITPMFEKERSVL